MLRKLWLTFAQAATICVAVIFVVSTLKPEWLPERPEWLPQKPGSVAAGLSAGSSEIPIREATERPAAAKSQDPGRSGVVTSYSEAVQRAIPSVVNIYTTQVVRVSQNPFGNDPFFRRFFGDQFATRRQLVSSLGSGVIVSPKGYILTNNHVVLAATQIEVALTDGRKAAAKVVGADPESDLAIIKIDLPNLPAIVLGRVEQARIGDVVLAIGNPFGVGQTVTMGIISALGRNRVGANTDENFVQTDAAINPGNSGGALVDATGNLIGINASLYSKTGGSLGIGYAVPVSTAKQVMESIIETGHVARGDIGVMLEDITPEMAKALTLPRARGVLIAKVRHGGPADKAGVSAGDIVVDIDGKPIADSPAMLDLVVQLKPGTSTKLKVLRGSTETELSVDVKQRPKTLPANREAIGDEME